MAAANFQRRQGHKEQACAFYEGAIQELTSKLTEAAAAAAGSDKTSNGTTTTNGSSSTDQSSAASDLSYLALQYAHFQRQVTISPRCFIVLCLLLVLIASVNFQVLVLPIRSMFIFKF